MRKRDRLFKLRVERPHGLLLTGLFLCVLPLIQYFVAATVLHIPFVFYKVIFRSLTALEIGLLLFPFVAGVGLLSVTAWGWYAAMFYALAVIGYNAFLLFVQPGWLQLTFLFQALLGGALLYYLLRPDLMAPFMSRQLRGFRRVKREEISVPVLWNGESFTATNVSVTGVYLRGPDAEVGIEGELTLTGAGGERRVTGRVVRRDRDGVGILIQGPPPR